MPSMEASSVVSMISLKPEISADDKLAAALPFRLGDLGEVGGFLRGSKPKPGVLKSSSKWRRCVELNGEGGGRKGKKRRNERVFEKILGS